MLVDGKLFRIISKFKLIFRTDLLLQQVLLLLLLFEPVQM